MLRPHRAGRKYFGAASRTRWLGPLPRRTVRPLAASGGTRGCRPSPALATTARGGGSMVHSAESHSQFRLSYSFPFVVLPVRIRFSSITLRIECYRFATITSFYRQKSGHRLRNFSALKQAAGSGGIPATGCGGTVELPRKRRGPHDLPRNPSAKPMDLRLRCQTI